MHFILSEEKTLITERKREVTKCHSLDVFYQNKDMLIFHAIVI
jgi:hypothetical protein